MMIGMECATAKARPIYPLNRYSGVNIEPANTVSSFRRCSGGDRRRGRRRGFAKRKSKYEAMTECRLLAEASPGLGLNPSGLSRYLGIN